MADLNELQASLTTKVVGSDTTGNETNYASVSLAGDLSVSDGLMSGGTQGSVSFTSANVAIEAKVGASRLSIRKSLTIMAFDSDIFWGYTSAVTTSTGTPLFKGQFMEIKLDANDTNMAIYIVCATAGKTARITESP